MNFDYDRPNVDKILFLMKKKGLNARQLSKILYGDKTTRDIISGLIKKPDLRSSTLIKLCRVLDTSIDSLFQNSDNSLKSQPIIGNHNIINSGNLNTDLNNLRAENRALKMVIEEKKARIEDLKKTNEDLGKRLDLVLGLGRKSDTKK